MIRRFTLIGLSMACTLLLGVSVAPAAEDFFKLVPDSTLGLVVVNRPAAADAKLQALARWMQVPLPDLLAMLKQRSGIQEGWDENGTIALLVLPPEGDSALPTPILLVPVTDYGKFLAQLKAEDATQSVTKIEIAQTAHWVRSIGGYAALTDASHRQALEKAWTPSKEVSTALAPWRKWLAGKDVAGMILRPGIVQVSVKAQQGIRGMKSILAAQSNEQAKAVAGVFDIYAQMFQVAEKEVSAFGFGLQLDEQDVLRVTSRTALISGGLVAPIRPSEESLLAGLPSGQFVVAAGGALSAPVSEAMLTWSINMMKAAPGLYGISEEKAKDLSALSMESMKSVRGISMMLGKVEAGGTIFSNTIGVMRVDHASEFMAAYEKDLHKYAELINGLHSPMLPPMEIEKSEVGGSAALQITMAAPKPLAGGEALQQARMMESFFGPGGKIVAWIVPADEHHVVLGYVSKESLQRAMGAIRQGNRSLASDAGVAKTAALLPSGATAAVYLNPAEMIGFVERMVPAITPHEANVKVTLPEFPKTPPVGFAVTIVADEVQTYLVVPAEVLKAIGPYVGKIKAMQSGAAPTPVVPGAVPTEPALSPAPLR